MAKDKLRIRHSSPEKTESDGEAHSPKKTETDDDTYSPKKSRVLGRRELKVRLSTTPPLNETDIVFNHFQLCKLMGSKVKICQILSGDPKHAVKETKKLVFAWFVISPELFFRKRDYVITHFVCGI